MTSKPKATQKATHSGSETAPSLGVPPSGPRRSARITLGAGFTAINLDTGATVEYRELVQSTARPRWQLAMNKELGCLFQGYKCQADPMHSVQGTDTCTFIHKNEIQDDKKQHMSVLLSTTGNKRQTPITCGALLVVHCWR